MEFDLASAKPVEEPQAKSGEFDLASAKPVEAGGSNIGHYAKMAGRAAIEGVSQLPMLAAELINKGQRTLGFDVSSPSQGLDTLLTDIGLDKPKTQNERLATDVVRGASGALASPWLGATGGLMASSGALGGLASGVARESGAGVGGQMAAGLAGGLVAGAPTMIRNALRGEGVTNLAKKAMAEGFVLPPTMQNVQKTPSALANKMQTWADKVRTENMASLANQEKSNIFAQKALGVPGTSLTDDVFEAIRQQAGKAYQGIKDIPLIAKTDTAFRRAINNIDGKSSQVRMEFPEVISPEVTAMKMDLFNHPPMSLEAMIDKVKQLRSDATSNFKAMGDPSKHALAMAQRNAADAMDDLVERTLKSANVGDLATAYKDARKLIAKSYDVEAVTNTVTGNVNANGLARLQKNGRPLTGELQHVARAAAAYPRAFKVPETMGANPELSKLDFAGAAGLMAMGHPVSAGAAALIGPYSRRALLSKGMQDIMQSPQEQVLPAIGASQMGLERNQ